MHNVNSIVDLLEDLADLVVDSMDDDIVDVIHEMAQRDEGTAYLLENALAGDEDAFEMLIERVTRREAKSIVKKQLKKQGKWFAGARAWLKTRGMSQAQLSRVKGAQTLRRKKARLKRMRGRFGRISRGPAIRGRRGRTRLPRRQRRIPRRTTVHEY